MKKLITGIFILNYFFLLAQDRDPKAKIILDELSKNNKKYVTISADITLNFLNKEKKITEKPQIWKIQVKGKKFRLEIPGNYIVSDGITLWNYNKDAKELTIKDFNPDNDEQNPTKIFSMYENGYKYIFLKEEKLASLLCDVIELYPAIKPEKKKFHTVKLYVDKVKKQIVQLKMLLKDGGAQVYEIKKFETNKELSDNLFVYDTKGLKTDQINDERN